MTEPDDLIARVRGRIAFLKDKGAVKDVELYEALLARVNAATMEVAYLARENARYAGTYS